MPVVQTDAVTMDAVDWRCSYGSETPELEEIAKFFLSQPISSSSAERNWSTYSYIHNVKRNRLNGMRADKLVFIHSNIRLLSRFSDHYKEGPYKKWDIEPDCSYYLDESAARFEEMRWELDGEYKGETSRAPTRAPSARYSHQQRGKEKAANLLLIISVYCFCSQFIAFVLSQLLAFRYVSYGIGLLDARLMLLVYLLWNCFFCPYGFMYANC